jgi:thiol-disulfide isomerase/thioredoxin
MSNILVHMIKMFNKSLIFLAFLIAAGSPVYSAGYNIRVKIDGLQDTTLLLAYHYGNRKYIKDTIRVDSRGSGVFSGDEALPGGIYLVVMPEMKYFELLIDNNQNFDVETTVDEPVMNMKVTGSEENSRFVEYHVFMNRKQAASSDLQERMKINRNDPDSIQHLQSLGNRIDREVQEYWKSVIDNNPGTLIASLVSAMQVPQVPEFEIPAGSGNPDSLRWVKGYEYNKNHFFDNVDFSDERLLRTPVLHNKLDQFLNRMLIQSPDSIIPQTFRIVELSRANDKVFQYVLVYLLNQYERSTIMGLDEVFVELAEKYYLAGEAYWASQETINKLRERVERLKPNLIGRTASEIKMPTPTGNTVSLHDTRAEYIILYFYEPGCGHCKVVTPRLNELYKKYRDSGLEIFGIYIYDDPREWTDYIAGNNLDWINVYDPENKSHFRQYYDIYSTPTIYILDADKTIIAKRIGIETVEQMMEELM